VRESVLGVEALRFAYPGGAFGFVLEHLRLGVGEAVAVLGPSGSGKSTLLRLLGGVLPADAGRILVAGTRIDRLGEGARRRFRLRRVGIVQQNFALLQHLSAMENVLLPCLLDGGVDAEARSRAGALAERLGVAGVLRRRVDRLSQGECQRIAICRALLRSPVVVLADEPSASLDRGNADQAAELLLAECRRLDAGLLLATHDPALAERCARTLHCDELLRPLGVG